MKNSTDRYGKVFVGIDHLSSTFDAWAHIDDGYVHIAEFQTLEEAAYWVGGENHANGYSKVAYALDSCLNKVIYGSDFIGHHNCLQRSPVINGGFLYTFRTRIKSKIWPSGC